MLLPKDYAKKLAKRAKESHIYRDYQFVGIEIAKILNDPAHKALYIKFAKDMDGAMLLSIARSVALRRNVKNKGAYFMRMIQLERELKAHEGKSDRDKKFLSEEI